MPDAEILAETLVTALAAGRDVRERLAGQGEPEPERAERALRRALERPELAGSARVWLAALLRTAAPAAGAEALVELADARRARGAPIDPTAVPTLGLVLGSSRFLARSLLRHPDWLDELVGELPPPPARDAPPPEWEAIRQRKYRGLLRIAARDLAGRAFRESLRELSDLADGCLAAGLAAAAAEEGSEPPALLALGKLGGRELNLSSDVDLLFVYDEPPGEPDLARNARMTRVVQVLRRELERPTAEGFGYRVDLDLRPEGRTGAIASPVEALLTYYEGFGQEWERQMLIRLRHVAGPEGPARAFAEGVLPFVYRRSIGPEVLHGVRAMKARIESERRSAGRDVEMDLKEGPGGIRDVEFLVQALQLFYAGRDPRLRTGNVPEALEALARAGVLPEATADALLDAYLWLRRAEHAVQLADERQTHTFPRERAAQIALARRMGYADGLGERARERMLDDWTAARAAVRAHFDELVIETRVEGDA